MSYLINNKKEFYQENHVFESCVDKWSVDEGPMMIDLVGREQHAGRYGVILDVKSNERFVMNVSK